MDSINTDERVDSFLSTMLEGYEANLQNVNQYIEQTEPQLNGAKSQKEEIERNIVELKDLLGLEEESLSNGLKLMESE